tara:strand:- start:934 stop:1182 length:249 start_codon:yes stop_codon:yes gene_type:complete
MSEFVGIEDVAKHFNVSVSTARAWVRQKEIPQNTYVKIGKTYRFKLDAVVEALLQKEIEVGAAGEADAMEEVLENFDVDEDF